MGDIRVNHSALRGAATDMGQASKDIHDRLELFENDLKPLRDNWSGEAQRAYQVAKGNWDRKMTELNTILHQAGGSVATSQQEYDGADRRGADRW